MFGLLPILWIVLEKSFKPAILIVLLFQFRSTEIQNSDLKEMNRTLQRLDKAVVLTVDRTASNKLRLDRIEVIISSGRVTTSKSTN